MFELKSEIITIQSNDETVEIEIKEMTRRQAMAIKDLDKKGDDVELYCLRQCVPSLNELNDEQIYDLPMSIYTPIIDAVMRLNGLSGEKETEKN